MVVGLLFFVGSVRRPFGFAGFLSLVLGHYRKYPKSESNKNMLLYLIGEKGVEI